MRHDFNDGKYTVISDNGALTALRHGEPWKRSLVGDNLVYWMLVEVDDLKQRCEVLRAERDHQRACLDSAMKMLTGIHALLYPAPITTTDGRMMVFRPKNLDPYEVLQELSDRIRALPDELERLRAERTPQPADGPAVER